MNPITRMMKSCINMPLKKALPLLFICTLVFAATTGCTTSTTNNTGGGGSSASVTDAINTKYSQSGYKVATPFAQSTDSNGYTTYKGVVDDGNNTLQPYRNNITIVMTPDRQSALRVYNASISQALANGYTKQADQGTSWWGSTGGVSYPASMVKITIREPSAIGVNPYGTNVYLVIDSGKFAVATDYQTALSQ